MRCLDDWEASSRGGWVAGWLVGSQGCFGRKEQPAPRHMSSGKGQGMIVTWVPCKPHWHPGLTKVGTVASRVLSSSRSGRFCSLVPSLTPLPAGLVFLLMAQQSSSQLLFALSFHRFLSSDWLCACLHLSLAYMCRKIDCEQ